MNTIEKIINKILEIKTKGLEESSKEQIKYFLDVIPNLDVTETKDYSLDIAFLFFENGEYKKALIYFKQYLEDNKGEDKEIINSIIDAYYKGNEEIYIKNYNDNCKDLKSYYYYYGEDLVAYEKIKYLPLWFDEESLYYLDLNKNMIFVYTKDIQEYKFNDDDINYIIFNDMHFTHTLKIEKETFKDNLLCKATKFRDPIHFVFNKDLFYCVMLTNKINQLFIRERICIYNDTNYYLKLFEGTLENRCIQLYAYKTNDMFLNIFKALKNKYIELCNIFIKNKEEIDLYYNNYKWIGNIQNKTPKVLILTSEFTTIVKYHCYYLNDALNRLGIETNILEYKFNEELYNFKIIQHINLFKPDIIFSINHMFSESLNLKKYPIFLTWMQDIPDLINLKDSVNSIPKNQFILNHFITDRELLNDKNTNLDKFIDAPICSSEFIYKNYNLTDKEKVNYSCDICIVAHNVDLYYFIEQQGNELLKKILFIILNETLNSDKIYLSIKELRIILDNIVTQLEYELNEDDLDKLKYSINSKEFEIILYNFNYIIMKINMVDVLLNEGFTNIKLWGREWQNIERFKPYAMGSAENGEELSKILQASKIVLGCNNQSSVQARVFETFLSGGFFINSYVYPDEDISDIRKFFKEEKEMIFFKTKNDLVEKVKYYLENEEERNRMAQIGREISLKNFTYTGLANRFLDYLQKYYKVLDK